MQGLWVDVRGIRTRIDRAMLPDPNVDPSDVYTQGQVVEPQVTYVDHDNFAIGLSLFEDDDLLVLLEEESQTVEWKETIPDRKRARNEDDSLMVGILKTVTGFLNTDGGVLLLGVAEVDERSEVRGIVLKERGYEDEDDADRLLVDKMSRRIGEAVTNFLRLEWITYMDCRLLLIRCDKSPSDLSWYLDDEKFFVRQSKKTKPLGRRAEREYRAARGQNVVEVAEQ